MCRLVENVSQNLFLHYRSCRIGRLELLTKVNFQDSGTQPRITCYFARAIIMTVNHTVNQRGEFHISHDASRLISVLSPRWKERSRVSREIFKDLNFKIQLIQGKFQWALLIFGM